MNLCMAGMLKCYGAHDSMTNYQMHAPKSLSKRILLFLCYAFVFSVRAATFTLGEEIASAEDWTLDKMVWSSTAKMYYFNSKDSSITSPEFDVVITSLVVSARNTNITNPRPLKIIPYARGVELTEHAWTFTPDFISGYTEYANAWERSLNIDKFKVVVVSGEGNTYIDRIDAEGVPFVDPPAGFKVRSARKSYVALEWENTPNVASNRLTVYSVAFTPGGYSPYLKYDFSEFSNNGSTTANHTADFLQAYPDFKGEQIRYPAQSSGEIQISGSEANVKGWLSHSGHDPYNELTLIIRAKRYNHADEAKTMSVEWTEDFVTTNAIAEIELGLEFEDHTVSLSSVESDKATIIFNAAGKLSNHRVIVDEIMFVKNFHDSETTTNVVFDQVFTAKNSWRIPSLIPNAEYFAYIVAFDENGKVSPRSERLDFRGGKSDGFAIRIR